jgi:hypothetical protein
MWKKILLGVLLLIVAGVGYFTYWIGGPSMVIGMLRYDQREEGKLQVGDPAPDVRLVSLDGKNEVKLSKFYGSQPLVLIFGSFT